MKNPPIDENSLCEYIMENQTRFYRYALRYTRNSHDAQDVLSEAVYRALKAIRSLKDMNAVQPWFYKILTRCALDHIRKHPSYDELGDYLESKFGNSDDEVIDLSDAISSLEDPYRTIVILRFFEDMKLNEIAQTLDMNLSTVKSRLYAALKILRLDLELAPAIFAE